MPERFRRVKAKARGLAIDISPLRTSRDFRLVMGSGLVTVLGSMVTYVTLPFQIKQLTGSYIAVGLAGAAELIPLIVFGLYGGALADSVDRKILVIVTEIAAMALSTILLLNSLLSHPKICRRHSIRVVQHGGIGNTHCHCKIGSRDTSSSIWARRNSSFCISSSIWWTRSS